VAEKLLPIETILMRLAEGPTRIASATERLTNEQLCAALGRGEWSAVEVLAHIRACDDVWGDYIGRILAEETPTIRAMNPRTWVKRTDYPKQGFKASFRKFKAQRAELLRVLESLTAKEWARKAMVTGVGRPIERTVWNYADRLAVHERAHLKQIEGIAAALQG
jgi:hypothetical protein